VGIHLQMDLVSRLLLERSLQFAVGHFEVIVKHFFYSEGLNFVVLLTLEKKLT
jgi:hypothetical protein